MDRIYIIKLKLSDIARKLCYRDEIIVPIFSHTKIDQYEILEIAKNQFGNNNIVSQKILYTLYPDPEFLQSLSPGTLVAVRKLHEVLKHSTNLYDNERGCEIFEVEEIFIREGEEREIVKVNNWSSKNCFYMDTGLFEPRNITIDPYEICFLDKPTEKEIQNFRNRRNKNIKVADIKRWANDTDDIETINTVWDIINEKEEGN